MPPDVEERCQLCAEPGGEPIWEDDLCRVVRVTGAEAAHYSGYCRVIWNAHKREMTDLASAERRHLLAVVCATEAALRRHYQPHKINLASLGNAVPHLHWHVIPRFRDDCHFPAAIWSEPCRRGAARRPEVANAVLHQAINVALSEEHGGTA